uniref:Uncharacterized protein n=1 Tax=Graphocephala atropunctata TaxID=36148 RepID=A0A1B6LAS6_9HEMI
MKHIYTIAFVVLSGVAVTIGDLPGAPFPATNRDDPTIKEALKVIQRFFETPCDTLSVSTSRKDVYLQVVAGVIVTLQKCKVTVTPRCASTDHPDCSCLYKEQTTQEYHT